MQVTGNNFTAITEDPTKSLPLRDLVAGTFKLLEHTPITGFGFNSFVHSRAANSEQWHAFGHHFAPKESWFKILKEPGLLNLVMLGKREGSDDSMIRVQIEPSARVQPGVMIAINEHHELPKETADTTQEDRNKAFLSSLLSQWDDFYRYAKNAREHLLAVGTTPTPKVTKRKRS